MATERDTTNHKKIWDDTALVDSWNEALDEYKKYHSVHARGGSVKDILKDDSSINEDDDAVDAQDDKISQPSATDQDRGEAGEVMSVDEKVEKISDARQTAKIETHDPPPDSGAGQAPVAFPTQVIMGSIQDESLKKLLMSWYYAGYYTGLYEGQQQQKAEQSSF